MYISGESWDDLINSEKSLAKMNLIKFLKLTNEDFTFENIYITNAKFNFKIGKNLTETIEQNKKIWESL
ncbi:MAG: hypothetical protein OSJ65_05315 [Bacilli bacterium]|nr:hypothetical protein [Bacilli bacterium]